MEDKNLGVLEQTPKDTSHRTATSYLGYEPILYEGRSNQSWDLCLDRLGFTSENGRKSPVESPRNQIKYHMAAFLSCNLTQYLRREDNPAAFDVLVNGFLSEYGPRWWGKAEGGYGRDHLQEPDSMRGYLFPRDAERRNSKFLKYVQDLFQYRARYVARKRKEADTVLSTLNFASIKPEEVLALGRIPTATNPAEPTFKRKQPVSSSPEETGDSNLMLDQPRAKKLKRRYIGGTRLPQLRSRSHEERSNSPFSISIEDQGKTQDKIKHETVIFSDDEEPKYIDIGSYTSGEFEAHVAKELMRESTPPCSISSDIQQHADIDSESNSEESPVARDSKIDPPPPHSLLSDIQEPAIDTEPKNELRANRQRSVSPRDGTQPNFLRHLSSESDSGHEWLISTSWSRSAVHTNFEESSHNDPESNHKWVSRTNTTSLSEEVLQPNFQQLSRNNAKSSYDSLSSRHIILPLENYPVSSNLEHPPWLNHKKLTFYNFASKIELVLHAQEDMRCVTVKLIKYFSYYHITFFSFLTWAIEYILPRNMEILTVTATYPWTPRQHVFRKTQVNDDFETFKKHLREAAARDPGIERKGCEIEMVLEVEFREP